jgi:anti-sigma regulatory factor (Ser/Thr protein kinase)
VDTVLNDEWLGDSERIPMIDEGSVSLLRERVRSEGDKLRLPAVVTASLVNVASELGHNQLAHAHFGEIALRVVEREGILGIEILAADGGDGILDPTEALHVTPRSVPERIDPKASLGIGLPAVVELADEVDFDIRVGEGTCIWARKFAKSVRRRRQIGLYGRPFPGERVSGDHGGFVRVGDALLVGLADGLGHGPEAREASAAAIATLRARSALPPEKILDACHEALAETRGVVMAVVRVPEPGGAAVASIVGNIDVHIYGLAEGRRLSGPSFVLGAPGTRRRTVREEHPLGPRDVLVLFSDGLSSRTDLEGELDLLREHPIVIAHQLAQRFGRQNDDVLVLVAR